MQDENVFVVEGMKCNACSYEGSVIEFSNGMSAGFAITCPKCNSGNIETIFHVMAESNPHMIITGMVTDSDGKKIDADELMKIMRETPSQFISSPNSAKQVSIAFAEWMKREGWEVCDTPPPTVQDDHLCVKWEYPNDYIDGDTVEGANERIDVLFDKFILQYNPK